MVRPLTEYFARVEASDVHDYKTGPQQPANLPVKLSLL